MKNLINYINTEDVISSDEHVISNGKMPKRGGAVCPWLKKASASQRRQNLKRGAYNLKTMFGASGHGSWWN